MGVYEEPRALRDAPVKAVPVGEVRNQVAILKSALGRTHIALNDLEDRLAYVTRSFPPQVPAASQSSKPEEAGPETAIAREIFELVEGVEKAEQRIISVLQRLEL
jgi:hypothetical protein